MPRTGRRPDSLHDSGYCNCYKCMAWNRDGQRRRRLRRKGVTGVPCPLGCGAVLLSQHGVALHLGNGGFCPVPTKG